MYLNPYNTLLTLVLLGTLVWRELVKHMSSSNNALFTQVLYLFSLSGRNIAMSYLPFGSGIQLAHLSGTIKAKGDQEKKSVY